MLFYCLPTNDFIVDFGNQLLLYLAKSIKSFSIFYSGTLSAQIVHFLQFTCISDNTVQPYNTFLR